MPAKRVDVTSYASKPPTDYHKWFAKWIVTEVGYDPETASSKRAAFLRGVSIATAGRPAFMDSEFLEEQRAVHGVNKRGPKPQEDKEEAPARRGRPAAKKAAPARRKPEVVEVVDDDDFDDDEDIDDELDEELDDDDDEDLDDDEDDDFEDDDDEDEEPPAPVARKRGRPAKKAATPAIRRTAKKTAPAKKATAVKATRRTAKPATVDEDDEFLF